MPKENKEIAQLVHLHRLVYLHSLFLHYIELSLFFVVLKMKNGQTMKRLSMLDVKEKPTVLG